MLQSGTCFNTKEKKKKTIIITTKQLNKQTKKQTNKENRTKQSVRILLFDQIYVHTTADQKRIFESENEGTKVDLVARKIFNQQLAYEWYRESF